MATTCSAGNGLIPVNGWGDIWTVIACGRIRYNSWRSLAILSPDEPISEVIIRHAKPKEEQGAAAN